MRTQRTWGSGGIGLLILIVIALPLLSRGQPHIVPTVQANPTILVQVPALIQDSPLPTVEITPIEYPTSTPFPTVPPPPTPTIVPGPSVTPLPLPKPAADAAGRILYPATKSEISPARDVKLAVYTVVVDKSGQPQGAPTQLGNNIPLAGFFAIHPSPNGRLVIIEDGWGIQYVLDTQSGKVNSPYHDTLNPMGFFYDRHPDNQQILLLAQTNTLEVGLWLLDPVTGKHVTLLMQYPSPYLEGGAVSPDGQRVVYAFKRDFPIPAELWFANTDGSNQRKVYTWGGDMVAFAWSPDNMHIAFLGDGLMVIDADGSNPHSIGKGVIIGYGFQPVWSPDGQTLAYVTFDGSSEGTGTAEKTKEFDPFFSANIHLVNVITGEDHALLNDGSTGNIDPAWSPDGSQLVFASNRSGASEVWLVNRDDSNLRQLTKDNLSMRYPQWIR